MFENIFIQAKIFTTRNKLLPMVITDNLISGSDTFDAD